MIALSGREVLYRPAHRQVEGDQLGDDARQGDGRTPIEAAAILTTDRLRLAPLSVDHAPEMHRVLADPELYRFTGGSAPTLEQLESRFRLQCADSPDAGVAWRNWIILVSDRDEAVGYVQATATDDVADIAWLVGLHWQRQGIATEATLAMCTWLAGQGIDRLTAHIHPDHRASAGVARAVGMTPTAELDAEGERIWSRGP